MDKFLIGTTSQYEVYAFSKKEPFSLDEYFIIDDEVNNNPLCRVIESYSASNINSLNLDEFSKNDLIELNLSNNNDIYIAKLRLEDEVSFPIKSNSAILSPDYQTIKNKIIQSNLNTGIVLGEIRGSKKMFNLISEDIKNVSPMFVNGKIVNQKQLPFIFDINSFHQFPHLGLFGGSGSGKTYGFNVILEGLMMKEIPTIVLDPHFEMDFNELVNDAPNNLRYDFNNRHEIFNIGVDVGIPFHEISSEEFAVLLEFAGGLSEPMRSTLNVIHQPGDSFILLNNRLDKLIELFEMNDRRELKEEELDYEDRVFYQKYKSGVSSLATLKALQWRIKSIESENIFNSNVIDVEKALKKRKTVVIRGTNRHLNMLSSYMFSKFYNKRRFYIDSLENNSLAAEKFPPFIICVDEAHIFAPNNQSNSPTKRILKTISQEGRKYGVYEVLATQRPALLDETIISQLSTKVIFRTTIAEDLNMISKETDLSEYEVKRLPYLNSGNAFISSAFYGNTMSIRFRANLTKGKISRHPFDELNDFNSNDKVYELIMKELPFSSTNLEDILNIVNDKNNGKYRTRDIEVIINRMVNDKYIKATDSPFGAFYEKYDN